MIALLALVAGQLVFGQSGPGDCYNGRVGEVLCQTVSGNSPLCKGISDYGSGCGSPKYPGAPCACADCHGEVCLTTDKMWPLSNCSLTWPLDPATSTGIFVCDPEGYYGPEPRSSLMPAGPQPLSFADEGAVVYTNPLDPKADSTRNNTYVDPASGALRFRLPLNLEFDGRSTSISLDMVFNNNKNRPKSLFSDF